MKPLRIEDIDWTRHPTPDVGVIAEGHIPNAAEAIELGDAWADMKALDVLAEVRAFAKPRAIAARNRGAADEERGWLDLLAIVDGEAGR